MTVEGTNEPTAEEVEAAVDPAAGIEVADIVEAEQRQAKEKSDKSDAKGKGKEKEDVGPTPEEVDRMARAKAAAERMASQRRAQEQANREAAQARYALQQREQEYARLRQDYERQQQQLQQFENDPLTYLRDVRKLPADELARRAVEDADPEARMKRMQEKLDAFETRERDREKRYAEERAAAQQQAVMRQAEAAFLEKAKDLEAYPNIALHAEHRPRALVREALEIIEEAYKRTGIHYSDEEALEYLESLYSKTSKRNETESKSNASASVTQNGAGAQATKTAGKPRTLSGKDAAQSSALPPNFDELSDQEQKRLMAEMYRRLATK